MHRRMQHVIDKTTQRCVSMRLTPDGVGGGLGKRSSEQRSGEQTLLWHGQLGSYSFQREISSSNLYGSSTV